MPVLKHPINRRGEDGMADGVVCSQPQRSVNELERSMTDVHPEELCFSTDLGGADGKSQDVPPVSGKHGYPMDDILRQISGEVRSACERNKRLSDLNLFAQDLDEETTINPARLTTKNSVSMCDVSSPHGEKLSTKRVTQSSSIDRRNKLMTSCRTSRKKDNSSTSNLEFGVSMLDRGKRKRLSTSVCSQIDNEGLVSAGEKLTKQSSENISTTSTVLDNHIESTFAKTTRDCSAMEISSNNETQCEVSVFRSILKQTNVAIVTHAIVERSNSVSSNESTFPICDMVAVMKTDSNTAVPEERENRATSPDFEITSVQFDRPFGGFENFAQDFDRIVENRQIDTTVLNDLLEIDSIKLDEPYARPKRGESPRPDRRLRFKQIIGRVVNECVYDCDHVALNNNNDRLNFHKTADVILDGADVKRTLRMDGSLTGGNKSALIAIYNPETDSVENKLVDPVTAGLISINGVSNSENQVP